MATKSGKRPDSLRHFAKFLTVVVVATFAFTFAPFLVIRRGPEAPLVIGDVRVQPTAPIPDRTLTVFVTAVGGSEFTTPNVWLFHATAFRNEVASVDPMQFQGGGTYALVIGPFANGAEVWMFAAASTAVQGPILSDHLFVSVGTVYRNSTVLVVANTSHAPTSPRPQTPVTVFTQVSGTGFIGSVFLSYGWFGRGTSGAGNRFMGTQDGFSYSAPIDAMWLRTFPAGTRFFYRVAANDFNGVSANSEVLSFEISAR